MGALTCLSVPGADRSRWTNKKTAWVKTMNCLHSEDEILALLEGRFVRTHPFLRLGRGDDCAELADLGPLAFSTDLFLEDIHFRTSYFTPEEIGHKALAVNLSDLAAAGAVPAGFSMGLVCPRNLEKRWLERVFDGMSALAERFTLPLAGGDISAGSKLGFSIAVWGKAAMSGSPPEPFLRRGAKPGDVIFTLETAERRPAMGLARLGLLLLEERGRTAVCAFPEACASLLSPWPLLEAGQALARFNAGHMLEHGGIAAVQVMDMSDGLLRDLPRMLRGYWAELELSQTCLHPELRGYFETLRMEEGAAQERAVQTALWGGEEYMLLCVCAPEAFSAISETFSSLSDCPVPAVVGRVTEESGLRLCGRSLGGQAGFDHFA